MNHEKRNDKIGELYASGETLQAIGLLFGLTKQRVHQVIKSRKNYAEIAAKNRYFRRLS